MKHTQYGLQPDDQYDDYDYPQPVIRVRTTNDYMVCVFGSVRTSLNRVPILTPIYGKSGKLRHKPSYFSYKITHHSYNNENYLPYPDMDTCSLVGVKISRSTRLRLAIYDMTMDELLVEYGDVE